MNIVKINNLSKSFLVGKQQVPVLRNLNFSIDSGKFVIICGPSGCGKSTLLHTILGLEQPTSGSVHIMGRDLFKHSMTEDERSNIRKKIVGMVYQQANWIRSLTVVENVALPLQLLGIRKREAVQKAFSTLEIVGMSDWANYLPVELSSGQQQRVALARAIVTDPQVIIADEPTGNLDFETGQNLMRLLQQLNTDMKKTIVMVTHDLEYLTYADQTVNMLDGRIMEIVEKKDQNQNSIDYKTKKLRMTSPV